MYQITRKNKISETLQLCYADGSVAETIEVNINVDQMGAGINKAYQLVGIAQETLRRDPHDPKLAEEYGNAIIALFTAIFGQENADKIISFYEGNESEMLLDIFPFLNEVILPAVKEASAARKAQLEAAAKLAKRRK